MVPLELHTTVGQMRALLDKGNVRSCVVDFLACNNHLPSETAIIVTPDAVRLAKEAKR